MTSRTEILRLVHRYLCEQFGDDPGAFEVLIKVTGDTWDFHAREGQFRCQPASKIELTRPQKKIIAIMPDGISWSAAKIAEETGYEEGPHIRTALAGLVKIGLLENDNEGYRLV